MYDELITKIRRCATDPMHCLSCGEDKDGRCFARLMKQAADAIEERMRDLDSMNEACIALYGALPRWIPVTERLPEAWRRVIVCAKHDGGLSVWDSARWSGKRWEKEMEVCYDYWVEIDEPVTHWMPLPEPPKEET
jgi:hypothetical protein